MYIYLTLSISKTFAYVDNLIFSKSVVATAINKSSAFDEVSNVIFCRSFVQMLRIAAWLVVAFVQNVKAFWIFYGKKESNAVRNVRLDFISMTHRKLSIPASGDCSQPWPTLIWATPVNIFSEVLNVLARKLDFRRWFIGHMGVYSITPI